VADQIKLTVPPVHLVVDKADVYILELVKHTFPSPDGEVPVYVASLYVRWKCWQSPKFHLIFKTKEEMDAKIKAEVAKFKLFVLTGHTLNFQRVC